MLIPTSKPRIVVLSGAGISAESGIKTFRDCKDGLWENYRIEDVCTPDALERNPDLVNSFYNMRRNEVIGAQPNKAHIALAEAEEFFDIQIVTQNVDDLHERAGSSKILHLHGELLKARSLNPLYIGAETYPTYNVGIEGIQSGQMARDGYLLRPDVIFFGESVPKIIDAVKLVQECDALIVVGTSLGVYPAAELVWHVATAPIYYIDPNISDNEELKFPCRFYKSRASVGIPQVIEDLKIKFLGEK